MQLRIRQERINKGWTLEYVAKQVGITKSAVHDLETERCKPSYEVLVKLLDLFKYDDPRELFKVVSDNPSIADTKAD